MEIAIIGLGRMGSNIALRLMRRGHSCIVYDRNPDAGALLAASGARSVPGIPEAVAALAPRRVVWIMLPAGEATEAAIRQAGNLLEPGDMIIDGGNTFWKDDVRRADALAPKGVHYVDVGTSGGIWGLERGYCLMIGGPDEAIAHLDPILGALAPGIGTTPRTPGRDKRDPRAEMGYLHAGPHGAGHFVKMIHNGIEYGMMQALAEGFDILRHADLAQPPSFTRYDFDLADVAEVWRRGSVVSSWLLDLAASALTGDPRLDAFEGHVEDSGEGRWTMSTAIEEAVPANVLSAALNARFRSRQDATFAEKLLSAMRNGFGGHREHSPT